MFKTAHKEIQNIKYWHHQEGNLEPTETRWSQVYTSKVEFNNNIITVQLSFKINFTFKLQKELSVHQFTQ